MTANQLPRPANSNISPFQFAGNAAISVDGDAALDDFVIALARNQARIDHLKTMSAANDNARH